MAELTVANYLAALQDDPWNESAMQGLGDALASGDPARTGDDPVRLLEFARRNHEVRGEHFAAARLMEMEVALVAGDPAFAAVLWRELGRVRREDLMDDAGARAAYEQSLALVPGDEQVEHALAQLAQVEERWQEISSHFVTQAEQATDPTLRTSLLVRAATIIWQYKKKGKNKEVDRLFHEALATDPASARAARLFELTLRGREKWAELGQVLLGVAEQTSAKDEQLGLFLGAARVFAHQLEDHEQAAGCYERVLDLAPAQEEALGYLVAYFTDKREWEHLVALYEDALRARQLKPDAEQGILLQIGMVHWRMLERLDRAEAYFARVRKTDPAQPVMLDYYRERYAAQADLPKLLAVLSDAQRRVEHEADKAKFALEIARFAQRDPSSTERAIDAFKLVLRHDPQHQEALTALKDLYRRSGKWNALVELLRGELDALPADDGPRRLGLLKEMLVIYRDELKLEATVLSTFNTILQIDPGDREAILELARTYERMGRYSDLIPLLTREADAEADPERKVALYLRVAQLWLEHFSNYNQATGPLEQVLAIDPSQREALAKLREIYAKKRAWPKLAEILAREEELTTDPVAKRSLLLELAALAGERLHDYPKAIALYRRILEIEPRVPGALDALEKLAERAKDWSTLAEVLEQRVSEIEEFSAKTKLLTRLGTLYIERMQSPALAASAWKRVLELDPKNGRAMRTLREAYLAASDFESVETLYAEAGDWEGYVDVLGSAADRAADLEQKKTLSFRAAEVYEQKLKEPARAFRSYERVLAVDPENERAVRALLPIYEKDDKWQRVAQLNEILLGRLAENDLSARLELMLRLVDVYQQKLRDGERAFARAAEAYALAPDDPQVVARLESATELSGAHERLSGLYAQQAGREQGEAAIALRRRVAKLASERLKRPEQAAEQLEVILSERPHDDEARVALERIYRTTGRASALRTLYTRRLEHARGDDERAELLRERARVEEELLGDADAAIESYRALAAVRPDDRAALAKLDKLLSSKDQHAALAPVLEARIALTEERKERVELLLRLAKLSDVELADVDAAVGALARVLELELEPTEPRAIEQLESIAETRPQAALSIGLLLEPVYERTSKLDKLARVLKRRLEASQEPGERRALKLRLAEIEGTLGDPKSAYGTLESAFLDNPQNPDLWDRITFIAEQANALEDLAVAFTTAIEMAELTPTESGELSARTARIYDAVLGQPERAEPFHKRVLAVDPMSEEAYQGLRELYTTRERWEELRALYKQRIEHTLDPQQRLELLLQVCFLYEEILDDVERAIDSYEAVLELDPGHPTSRRALERLYARGDRHLALVRLLETERGETTGKEAIELSYRIGELYEHKLKQPPRAVDQYAAVLEDQPTHLRAQEALARLVDEPTERKRVAFLLEPIYAAQGAYPELARMLEVQLEYLSDPGERVAVLMRLGELRERELRDVAGAYEAFARAVRERPSDAGARVELARIAATSEQQPTRAALLEEVLGGAGEPRLRSELLSELATLYDNELADRERALDAYTRLIAVDPHDGEVVQPAARALERLHAAAGNHALLADDLRLQIGFERDPTEKARLLARLAELCERELGDLERAIEAYVEQLDLEPSDEAPLRALERLYAVRKDFPRLIGILQRREASVDEAEARAIARRIGEIYERDLDDRENAIVAYHDVLTRFGNDRETLTALARVYEAADRPAELLEVLVSELELIAEPSERAGVRYRAAELMRKRTGAPEAALEAYQLVLAEQPRHEGAARALAELVADGGPLRVDAARVLIGHAEAAHDHEQLIAMLEVVAEVDEPRERLDALRRASMVAETKLNDPARAYRLTARAVRASLEGDALGEQLDELDRLARAAKQPSEYVAELAALAPEIDDEDLALSALMRAAIVSRDELAQPAEARAHFERVLAIRPDHPPALDALEILHERAGDHARLLAVLVQKTELAGEPEQRAALLLRQAQISARELDDVPRAITAYERLLEERASLEVFTGLEPLYVRAERYDDLGSLYERQLELELGDPVLTRFRLAELCRVRRGDPEHALELYRDVLERSPQHDGARAGLEELMQNPSFCARAAELLEPVYLRAERWADLSRALEAQLEPDSSLEHRKELLGRLAQLHEVQLEDLEAALDTYARLFAVDPSDAQTLEALTRLARVLGKQLRLAEVYEAYLDEHGVHDELAVRLSMLAAQIRDQHAHDLERATALYQRAWTFDPSGPTLTAALEELLERRGAHEELRAFYRTQADLAETGEKRIAVLRKLAGVIEVELRDLDGAIGVHREILEIAEADTESIAALDRLLAEGQRWGELAEHLQYQIDRAAGAGREVPLKLRLARLYEQRLDDIDAALETYADIARLAPEGPDARAALERLAARPELLARVADILEPLYQKAGTWEKQIWLAEQRIQIASDATERAELYRTTAELYEQRGESKTSALEAYRRALVSDPSDAEARREVERLAAELEDWDALVAALEEAAQATSESELKASLLGAVARTHDERRGDPRAAIQAYERLVQCDTDDAPAFEQLEALLTMVGDWTGLVSLLRRKVERSYDPVERAELWRRAGSVLDELMDDAAGAITAYAAALEEVEDDRASLSALDDLYGRAEDYPALAEVLRRRAELADDQEERLDVNTRLGRVLAERLAQPRKAIDAYAQALDDDPARLDVLVALGKLYAAESMWPELLDNLRRQLELTPEPSARIVLLFALGQVHDEHLSEFDEAIESYREALTLDASYEPAIRALMHLGEQADYRAQVEEILEPLLRDGARWDDLATLLSRGIASIEDAGLRQERLIRLAEIHERGRNDLAAAFDALSEALVQDADAPGLPDEVERLAGRLATWDRAADALGHRADRAGDADVARDLRRRLGRIVEHELSDVPRTIEVYERALSQSGDDDSILTELDRLYTSTDRHEELADVLERRVSQADGPLAVDLLLRLGTLRETRFGDARAALNAYRDVLERAPCDPRAMESLERLLKDRSLAPEIVELLEAAYRDAGDLQRVAQLYEARLGLVDLDDERARLLTELAALYEHELDDSAKAAEVLRRAFELDPRDFGLLDEIERVAHAAGRFDVLAGLVETAVRGELLPRADRRDLWMRAAAWYRERLADLVRAEHALRQAIEIDPDYEPAHEALVTLLRGEGRHRELVDALFAWSERETDKMVAVERFIEAAVVAETAAGQPERAIEGYERVLALDPSQLLALDALIRVYEAGGKLGKVAQLYDRRVEAELDPETRVDLRHRAAALRADKLEDRDGAIRLELKNLEEDPNDAEALDALERLYEQTERFEELARILSRRLEVTDDLATRTRVRVRLALVAEQQLGDKARAIEELREIVLEVPDHLEASIALERLLEAEGRHADLVDQLERRSERARDAKDSTGELALLVRIGEIVEERLGDKARAISLYERVIARAPGHVEALRALARLHLMSGDAARAADLLDTLLGQLSGEELAEAAYALAEIAERTLSSPERAEAALKRALGVPGRERETRDRIIALYERTGAHGPLAAQLADEAELSQDKAQKVAYLRRASELYRDKLQDNVQAAALLERASALVPDDRSVLVPLCELYIAAGRQADAIPVLEKIIASYGGRRVKEVSIYHRMLAKAHRGLNQVDRALAELDAAYRVDLTNIGVLADLGLLAFEQGDLERAQKTFRGLLLQKLDRDAPVTKADVYYYLGDISRQQGDRPKAISMLERAIAEQASHERARTLLATLRS